MAEGGENINGEQEMSASAGVNILGDIDKFVDNKLVKYVFRPIFLGETDDIRPYIAAKKITDVHLCV
jgi:hypothetical protein